MKLKNVMILLVLFCFLISPASAARYHHNHHRIHETGSNNDETYGTGNDVDELYVKLVNNPNAKDPTYNQLVNFIKKDQTDRKKYVPGVYMCDYFARDVHNNAEKAGIKAGYVALTLKNPNDEQYCNVFKTVDKGLIYVDCTGEERGGVNCDCQVKQVKVGVRYHPVALYQPSYRSYYQGTISSFKVYW